MLTVRGQQHSFSTHERVFLWMCQRFWERKCLDLRVTRTPNLRIHAECSNLLSFLAWSSIAQSVCQQAFNLLANRCLRPWVRILHSAEEDNLSPFDSNIACLCQSIEINNIYTVYRNKQVSVHTNKHHMYVNTHIYHIIIIIIYPNICVDKSWSTLDNVMNCCLTASTQHLNQCRQTVNWKIKWMSKWFEWIYVNFHFKNTCKISRLANPASWLRQG